jgi:hypothetical protein
MLKLTKAQKKRTFHLPVEQVIYVPSTTKADKKIPDAVLKKRVQNVRKYLSQKFGGYTSVRGTGGYYSDKKNKLIKEKIIKVTSFAEKSAFNKNKNAVLKKLSSWGRQWGQESVGYEHEGDMYYISTEKKKREISDSHKKKLLKNLAKARAKKRK